jgi:signal transduction histidine kinase
VGSDNLGASNRTIKPAVTVLLFLSFGALLLLIGILGAGTLRRTQEIYEQITVAQRAYEEVDQALRDLPADIHLAGILVRDYALDPSPLAAPVYKELLAKEQHKIESYITRLNLLQSVQREKVESLQKELQAYADSFDPILSWSPQEKVVRSFEVIRQTLIPRRQAIVALAGELSLLNAQHLALQRQASDRGRRDLQRFVRNLLIACLTLGLAVAVTSIRRALNLERRSHAERERAVEAEREQRRLAMRVVQVQEEERKRIALELHDAVGQMASALGMELGRLENLRQSADDEFHEKIVEVKQMNADVIRALKDLATGLRPAMLDQLGLGPALRSHAREFERRTGISTDVRLEGSLDAVPEPHRTCIYRIVQEALNNIGRHANARNVLISLFGAPHLVSLAVQDDGAGFDVAQKAKSGLGLLGIAERARDLNGQCRIDSKPGSGTVLTVELPVQESEAA